MPSDGGIEGTRRRGVCVCDRFLGSSFVMLGRGDLEKDVSGRQVGDGTVDKELGLQGFGEGRVR